jgi:hypothetical protein
MDVSLDPFESRLDKLFVKSRNTSIGVYTKSWQPLQFGSFLQSESNIQNMLDLNSFFPCTKILEPKVTWWAGEEYWEYMELIPWSYVLFMRV